jgi:hypothetical protein
VKTPKQTLRLRNRTVTLTPEVYAIRLTNHARAHLQTIVDAYRDAPANVQALLLGDLGVSTALAWASSQAPEQART